MRVCSGRKRTTSPLEKFSVLSYVAGRLLHMESAEEALTTLNQFFDRYNRYVNELKLKRLKPMMDLWLMKLLCVTTPWLEGKENYRPSSELSTYGELKKAIAKTGVLLETPESILEAALPGIRAKYASVLIKGIEVLRNPNSSSHAALFEFLPPYIFKKLVREGDVYNLLGDHEINSGYMQLMRHSTVATPPSPSEPTKRVNDPLVVYAEDEREEHALLELAKILKLCTSCRALGPDGEQSQYTCVGIFRNKPKAKSLFEEVKTLHANIACLTLLRKDGTPVGAPGQSIGEMILEDVPWNNESNLLEPYQFVRVRKNHGFKAIADRLMKQNSLLGNVEAMSVDSAALRGVLQDLKVLSPSPETVERDLLAFMQVLNSPSPQHHWDHIRAPLIEKLVYMLEYWLACTVQKKLPSADDIRWVNMPECHFARDLHFWHGENKSGWYTLSELTAMIYAELTIAAGKIAENNVSDRLRRVDSPWRFPAAVHCLMTLLKQKVVISWLQSTLMGACFAKSTAMVLESLATGYLAKNACLQGSVGAKVMKAHAKLVAIVGEDKLNDKSINILPFRPDVKSTDVHKMELILNTALTVWMQPQLRQPLSVNLRANKTLFPEKYCLLLLSRVNLIYDAALRRTQSRSEEFSKRTVPANTDLWNVVQQYCKVAEPFVVEKSYMLENLDAETRFQLEDTYVHNLLDLLLYYSTMSTANCWLDNHGPTIHMALKMFGAISLFKDPKVQFEMTDLRLFRKQLLEKVSKALARRPRLPPGEGRVIQARLAHWVNSYATGDNWQSLADHPISSRWDGSEVFALTYRFAALNPTSENGDMERNFNNWPEHLKWLPITNLWQAWNTYQAFLHLVRNAPAYPDSV